MLLMPQLSYQKNGGEITALSLINAGTRGFMLDFTDTAQLYQDNLGATPVTTAGQTIGLITDISAVGNDFSQATATRRPTWTTAGGYACANFDGTDNRVTSTNILYDAGATTMVVALNAAAQDDKRIYSEGNTGTSTPHWAPLMTDTNSPWSAVCGFLNTDGGVTKYGQSDAQSGDGTLDSTWKVVTVRDSGTDIKFRVNGGAWQTGFSYTRAATTLDIATIGCLTRTTPTSFYVGNIARLLAADRALSDENCTILEQWAGDAVGITI